MPEQLKITRRTFFTGLGVAAAAGVAAKLSSKTTAPAITDVQATQPESTGYRLTEHIKKYYRTTTL